MRSRMKEKREAPLGFAVNAAIGSLVALGCALVLLLIASFLVVSGRLPEGLMGAVTVGVVFVSSAIGALVAIRRNKGRALVVGIAAGVMLYGITLVGGAFTSGPTLFGELSLLLLLAAVLGGGAAGFIAARPKKRKI